MPTKDWTTTCRNRRRSRRSEPRVAGPGSISKIFLRNLDIIDRSGAANLTPPWWGGAVRRGERLAPLPVDRCEAIHREALSRCRGPSDVARASSRLPEEREARPEALRAAL